jgi:spore germination cell wall hydrolase CwlJ-like protein
MKTLTKIVALANVAIVASMGYLYYDMKKDLIEVQVEHIQHEQVLFDISDEVSKQMEYVKNVHCLSMNVYHEARNEGMTGQRAVAWVTLNRVNSKKYPDTICDVVYQAHLDENGIPKRNKCSFSWFCDQKSDEVTDQAAWNVAENIANEVMNAYGKETDPTNGSIMYHADYVEPYWAASYEKQARIDSHIFYK